jgi:hypothetical protein
VRILGVAPVVSDGAGKTTEQPLFWIYYPDSRSYLAEHPVMGANGWYDILENQAFTATVEKTTSHKHP